MNKRLRLIKFALALALLFVVGRVMTGSFHFVLHQFWFIAGLFLLILLSLIDQPFFSKDANIFINGTTAWVSLFIVDEGLRDGIWNIFFAWALYLIISSYALMWVRQKQLGEESRGIQFFARLNRHIGRPEAIFSSFFLWGCYLQFGSPSPQLNTLFLFWALFMILNLPGIAQVVDNLFEKRLKQEVKVGVLSKFISPRVGEVEISPKINKKLVSRSMSLMKNDSVIADGVIFDDRIIAGKRIGKVAFGNLDDARSAIADENYESIKISINEEAEDLKKKENVPISVVDAGTEIGILSFYVHPDINLQEGEVIWVSVVGNSKAYYQIVSAKIVNEEVDGNIIQRVKVTAGQLGGWDESKCRFSPFTWVAPAGELIYRASALSISTNNIPEGHAEVGKVPNSDFPVHINLNDAVTHNTSIIGVTGSGKSYLAFHLIEKKVERGIKVLILDISSQYEAYLSSLSPARLSNEIDVENWMNDENSLLGVCALQTTGISYPLLTSKIVAKVFESIKNTTLEVGRDEPAKVCIVFEEAHSLIPEWNQVANKDDTNHVNRTARIILQGRKFGLGSLIISQRTANVTKTILNQCNTIFALQSFDQTGLDFLKNYMGEQYAHAISTLPARQSILVGKASSSTRPIIFKIQDLSSRWKDMETEEAQESQV